MIELSRHIESLLLKHDCVIVPGLGGFVTQYVPARRIADEQLFLPPFRSVGFNPELAINDGLLAQSYMHAYDTTYPESLKLIEDAVSELKEELTEKGEFTLHGIGRLTIGIDGRYNFQPNEAGVISPELYGLDSFIIPELSQKQEEAEAPLTAKQKIKRLKPTVKRTDKHYTISLNRELVNYVSAAVVALFFYFIWATPINNGTTMGERQSAAFFNEQLFSSQPSTPKAQPVVFTQQAEAEDAPAQTESKPQQAAPNTEEEEESTIGKGRYTIVLASAIPQANAKELTSRLQSKGMDKAMTYKKGRMVRVVYGNFASKAEAQQTLKALHGHADFAQAWVMEVQ